MSYEELRELQVQRFNSAMRSGTIRTIFEVCRCFGHDPVSRDSLGNPTHNVSRYGPKYAYRIDGVTLEELDADNGVIDIYVDDFGG